MPLELMLGWLDHLDGGQLYQTSSAFEGLQSLKILRRHIALSIEAIHLRTISHRTALSSTSHWARGV